MSDPKPSRPKIDILKRLLDTPQLLPHESSKEFLQLFASFEDYGKPRIHVTIWQCIRPRC